MKKSVVLLSGGMDSSVNLLAAREESQVVLALTFDYGQRAAPKEIEVTSKLTKKLQIPHRVLPLPFFSDLGHSSLIDRQQTVPVGSAVSIDDPKTSEKTAQSVWVPNRNGIFLNVAAGFAEALGADWIVPGFNQEEASTFPDNSEEYLQAATQSLKFSTANQVQVKCFTVKMNKTEIVGLGLKLQMDWSWMWPCYFNQSRWCGQCESCQRSKRALRAQGVAVETYFESAK
ncbi:MAG: 7-cyano-7-deazaguanine synthase QueC [Pseudobdellovibrionaceae bacterium]